MSDKSPQEKAEDLVEQIKKIRSGVAEVESLVMAGLGEITSHLLKNGTALSLDSLLDECSKRMDSYPPERRELSVEWHRLRGIFSHLEALKNQK